MPSPKPSSAAGPASPRDVQAQPAARVWRTGTLSYGVAGLLLLFVWLLGGDFAWSLKERSVPAVVQLLLKRYGATDLWTGLLLGTLPSVISMVLGPYISCRSDRHRGRLGRRIPYLILTTPFAVLAMMGLALGPTVGQWIHALPGFRSLSVGDATIFVLGSFWSLFEVATVAANAIFIALINDVVPREMLGRFFGLFRALSLIAGMVFNYWLLGKSESHFAAVFVGLGLLYGGGFAAMCLKVKEGAYPPPVAEAQTGRQRAAWGGILTYFRECFGHAFYLWVFAAFTLANLAFFAINLFNLYLAKSLAMDMDFYGKLIALAYLISLLLSYLLGHLADRFHPLRVGMVFLGLYALLALVGGFLATTTAVFAAVFVLHTVLAGAYYTATASLGQRLYPQAKFAQFASAATMLLSASQIVIAPFIGRMLDLSGHVYRYTYYVGFGLAVLGLLASFEVCRRIAGLGGFDNYLAPGETFHPPAP